MNLANPLFLLAWIALFLLIWWREVLAPKRARAAMPFPDARIPRQLPATWRTRHARWPSWLIYAGIALAVLAWARPRGVLPGEAAHARGIDILLVLDTSASMRALDFDPRDRMSVAIEATRNFISKRRDDRIGLLVFAGVPLLQCPLTLDYGALMEFLGQVEPGMTGTDNTAIGTALAAGANRLQKSTAKSRILVLITDGRSNAGEVDPETAAKAAEAVGIRIYTIGVGKRGESVIPVDTPFGRQLAPITDDLDEPTLQTIARSSGGRYFRATSPKEFNQIFSDIDKLERSDIEAPRLLSYEDRYRPWLLAAMILLCAGFGLQLTLWRTFP